MGAQLRTGGKGMTNKGISVWLFSFLTFIVTIHLAEATYVLISNSEIRLLQLYPFINDKAETISPIAYFWVSAGAALTLWGITCAIAFDNPVETFLNKILAEAKQQTTSETQTITDKSEILDLIYETIESDNETLSQIKDVIFNVRADVREIEPLKENVEKLRTEMTSMKKDLRKLQEKPKFPTLCPTCGKPIMPEFKSCPYCGEGVKILSEQPITVEAYR